MIAVLRSLYLSVMKRLLIAWCLAAGMALPAAAAPLAPADAAALTATIDAFSASFLRGDADAMADAMADPLLAVLGGRAKSVEGIQSSLKMIAAQGVKVVSHQIGRPGTPVRAGDALIVVVPETTVMAMQGKQAKVEGFTVGVRPAAGGAWKLIGGEGVSHSPGIIAKLYPGFPSDYVFPEFKTTPL